MNKLFLIALAAFVLIVGGAYLVGLNKTEAPSNGDPTSENGENGNAEMNAGETSDENGAGIDVNGSVSGDGVSADVSAHVSFDVTGKNFEFSQKEIRVKKGDMVTVNFTSTDGFHDWTVDAFDAATDRVQTGGSASVTFVADNAGSFEFYCSVGSHRQLGMVGTLVVEE